LALGFAHPRYLKRYLTSKDLAEWAAYDTIEPFGEERADFRTGIICSQLDACHRVKGSVQPPIAFMPFSEKPQHSQTEASMKAIFRDAKRSFERKP